MTNTINIQKSVLPPKPFLDGFMSAFSKIDGEKFAQSLPPLCVWFTMLSISVYFLWHQSLEIYQSAGFLNPLHAAAGGLAMILGFSAYFS